MGRLVPYAERSPDRGSRAGEPWHPLVRRERPCVLSLSPAWDVLTEPSGDTPRTPPTRIGIPPDRPRVRPKTDPPLSLLSRQEPESVRLLRKLRSAPSSLPKPVGEGAGSRGRGAALARELGEPIPLVPTNPKETPDRGLLRASVPTRPNHGPGRSVEDAGLELEISAQLI